MLAILSGLLWLAPLMATSSGSASGLASPILQRTGDAAPDFTLTDVSGHPRSLKDLRGRPCVIWFFCGCPWCHQCAEAWAHFQRGGVLPPSESATTVVFAGETAQAKSFAIEAGLDMTQTSILTDPDQHISQVLYGAEPCPRVFVIDSQGRLHYTNNHKSDAGRQAPALAIASYALDAVRALSPPTISSQKPVQNLTLPPAPLSLKGVTFSGNTVDIAAQPGWKVIYFWSATCPCVRACESFTFLPLYRQYHSKVSFYTIASNGYDLHLPPDQLQHQVEQHKLPYPMILDGTHLIAQALNAKVTPQAFLLDPQNHIVFDGIPDDSRRYQARTGTWGVTHTYLAQAIAQALAGKPVSVPRVRDEGCIIAW